LIAAFGIGLTEECVMERIKRHNIGSTRRGFLTGGTGVLLTGAFLGASQRAEAQGGQDSARPNASLPRDLAGLVSDLVVANRILFDQGVVDGYGHVSVRHPAQPNHFLISRWLAPDLVTESDILELDLECHPVTGDQRKLYSERFIHSEIYRAQPEVGSIVHTHAPMVVLMGVCGEPLMPIYHMTGFLGTGVPVFDIRKAAGMTDMLISDAARGKALAQSLGDKPAVLMRGHGGVTVGSSLSQAVGRSVYLKINAELQLQVLGRKVEFLAPEEARLASVRTDDYPKDWEMWKREVMRKR
jgi:ribulose-5-phosphate 4-epimerase/fuculose-1-phosphate aldolase